MKHQAKRMPGAFSIRALPGDYDFVIEAEIPFIEKQLDELTEKEVGGLGERLVSSFFEGQGYEFVKRNVHYDPGEVDVLCFDDPYWVLCEVKTRIFEGEGEPPVPEVAITERKKRIYRKLAAAFYSLNPDVDLVRFDAAGVTITSATHAHIHYLPSAWDMVYWV